MTDVPQPYFPDKALSVRQVPRHVAIIMDGNGRWAKRHGLPRVEGHRKGVDAVRTITQIAGEYGIEYLTLYSFSSENWNRPESEINELFGLLRFFVRKHLAELHQNHVRVVTIGDKKGVPDDINRLIGEAVEQTRHNHGLTLVIAFNYGARHEIVAAARMLAHNVKQGIIEPEDITVEMMAQYLQTKEIPDPDLIIRTSGEKRLSNFLLWQAAYSEFVFTECNWPDFDRQAFMAALDEYHARDRRFGALSSIKQGG